jgi:hypothetical protein
VLDTAALPPGSRIDFTWRDGQNWTGRDISVGVIADPSRPDEPPKDHPARGAGEGI